MSKRDWTPGPWNVHPVSFDDTYQIEVDGEFIAWSIDNPANCNLMTAAPDMFEALDEIANVSIDGPHVSAKEGFKAAMEALDAIRCTARAAIAKATNPEGEQP